LEAKAPRGLRVTLGQGPDVNREGRANVRHDDDVRSRGTIGSVTPTAKPAAARR
jgi:hypothetical protein